jgi:4-amino-4-deoxy-L-arabinose transferase-like glycosyltransferase
MTSRLDERPWLAVALVIAAFLVPVLAGIARATAFGYDESIYAQLSRALAGGPPAAGAGSYRPPGLGLLGLPAALVSNAEWPFRLVGALGGIGLVSATWWVARLAGGGVAALVAAVAVAAAWPVQIESTTFLTDVPAAALVVLAAGLTWRALTDAGGRREWIWLGAVAAAAFFIRFGSILPLSGIALAGLVVGTAPARLAVIRAAAVCAVLLLPHAVHATATTGAPWGIVSAAQRATGEGAGTEALVAYLAMLPAQLMGPLAGALAVVGLIAAVREAGSSAAEARFARFTGIAAVVPMVALVVSSHAEARYAFAPVALLAVLGATRLVAWAHRLVIARPALRIAVAGIAAAGLVGGSVMTLDEIDRRVAVWGWTRDVARAIDADSEGTDCVVVASDAPIMAWYARCAAATFGSPPSIDPVEQDAATRQYVVLRADGHHQPPGAADALPRGFEPWRTFTDGDGAVVATVYRSRDGGR